MVASSAGTAATEGVRAERRAQGSKQAGRAAHASPNVACKGELIEHSWAAPLNGVKP